jgi:hypothetical protein
MARMLPSEILDDHNSPAETRLFRKIKTETPDDWIAVHSVGLTNHSQKPWAEIDFVLIANSGVWCLEVKGGGVEHRDGRWYTNDNLLKESPFAQAGGGAAALFEYLKTRVPTVVQAIVGYGVCFPDTRWEGHAPEIDEALIYDDDDLERPFEQFVHRIAARWQDRLAAKRPSGFRPLSPADRGRVLHEIAPDFRLVPSLRSRVSEVEDQLLRLTDEQAAIVEGMKESDRVIVKGGAGTGKTLLALHEARRLAQEGFSTLLCCFSTLLADELRTQVAEVENLEVRHLHGLMRDLISDAELMDQLPEAEAQDIYDIFYPQLSLEALDRLGRIGTFEALVVDEAQDLMKASYSQVFDALLDNELAAGRWRVFHDPNQDRFSAADNSVLEQLERHAECSYRLWLNCRNTRQIAFETAILSSLPVSETVRTEGPDVAELWYDDEAHQAELLAKHLKSWVDSGLRPDQITVLSPRRFERSVASRVDRRKLPGPLVDVSAARHADDSLRFSTIARFKGLESDAIAVVDIDDLEDARALLEIYIGASRARALLAVFLAQELSDIYKERVADFLQRLEKPHVGTSQLTRAGADYA